MKRKLKRIWLAVCMLLFSLCVLCGCKLGVTLDGLKAEYNLTAQVNYYGNGGLFETNKSEKTIWYSEGMKAAPIGEVDAGSTAIKRNNYEFLGWYEIKKDSNGNFLYLDEEAKIFQVGAKFDFSNTTLKAGDVYDLCAGWKPHAKVVVKLSVFDDSEARDTESKIAVSDTVSYGDGDEVYSYSYNANGEVPTATLAPFKAKDDAYTFLSFYADAECQTPVAWPIRTDMTDSPSDDEEDAEVKNTYIYAKYLKGAWTVLKDKSDINDLFSNAAADSRFYLFRDIDCGGRKVNPIATFGGELRGNGYTISGLKITKTGIGNGEEVALFGHITDSAKITDVTLNDVHVEYTVTPKSDVKLYYAFASVGAGATVENVRLCGSLTLTYKADGEDKVTTQNGLETGASWKYGGYATDAEYAGGFTVDAESKLTVNEQEIV